MNDKDIKDIINSIKGYLEIEGLSGTKEFFCAAREKSIPKESGPAGDAGGDGLEKLKSEVMSCALCQLHKTKTHYVFGAGSAKAKLMFVGEAPGRDEDLQGVPFVGRAGQLLTKIIESIGLKRSDVYIANILKCRPPENRNPLPTEILSCQDYLFRQIDLIKPKIICALGKFAAQTLLKTNEPITRIRGKFYEYGGALLIPTFHPAYLLRNPDDKKLVWHDMKKIREKLRGA